VPHGDITEIDAGAIPEHDMLTAGFPCQSFSRAGGQAGLNADTGQLFFEVVRVLASSQPRCFLLENVADLERHDGGLTFAVVRAALEGAGAFVRAGGCVCVWVRGGVQEGGAGQGGGFFLPNHGWRNVTPDCIAGVGVMHRLCTAHPSDQHDGIAAAAQRKAVPISGT
jgi:hypothetical protein